jgi:prevent-host-death family protein
MKLGLREANQRFSKVIKAVRAGKEVVLTDRGCPIAVIKPTDPLFFFHAVSDGRIDEIAERRPVIIGCVGACVKDH